MITNHATTPPRHTPSSEPMPFSPLLICGPCSAESEQQVLTIGRQVAAMGVKIFRAGLWKPRTSPGSFEGVGAAGLPWLRRLKAETGLLIATEVALPEHVEQCLRAEIDMVWIGARTTVSPFAVQQIAESLNGTELAVMVKNPLVADIDLWIGAIERLRKAGIRQVYAIHRGFSVYGEPYYRYPPLWHLTLELARRMPEIPIIGDPSHMSGHRELVETVALQCLRRGYKGLMIECHPSPATALSDSKQQLTPEELGLLLTKIKQQSAPCADQGIELLRDEIDDLDDRLLTLLAERMTISDVIGRYKHSRGVAVVQQERFDAMMTRRREWAGNKAIDTGFVDRLFQLIHQESIRRQLSE